VLGLRRSTTKPLATGFRGIEIVGIAAAAACSLSRKVGAGALIDRRRGWLIGGEGVLLPALEKAGFGDGPSYTEGVLILMTFITSNMAMNLLNFPIKALLERGPPSLRLSPSKALLSDRLLNFNFPFFRYFRRKKNISPIKIRPPTTPIAAPAIAILFEDVELLTSGGAMADGEEPAEIDDFGFKVVVGSETASGEITLETPDIGIAIGLTVSEASGSWDCVDVASSVVDTAGRVFCSLG